MDIQQVLDKYDYNSLNLHSLEQFKNDLNFIKNDKIKLSLITLLFKFQDYIPIKIRRQTNSFIYKAVVKMNGETKILFFKLKDAKFEKEDSIIIDIFNSILFNNVLVKAKYRKHFPLYVGSSYTYMKMGVRISSPFMPFEETSSIINIPVIWNYNNLINFSSIYSPYHTNNIRRLGTSSSNFIDSYMIIYEAINGNAIIDILEYGGDIEKKILIIKKFREFYEFLCKIGIKYGFIHNDLHLRNLIYDEETQSIKIIDFGRSSFNYKVANLENDRFLLEVKKIDLSYSNKEKIYEDVFNRGNPFFKSSSSINGNFLGILSDIISLSLSFYLNIDDLFNELKIGFSNLLELDRTSVKIKFTNDKEILIEYIRILMDFDKNFEEIDEDIKYSIRYLLDGLFLASLYFRYCGLKQKVYSYEKLIKIKIMSEYRILLVNQDKLDKFISHIIIFLSTNLNPDLIPILSKNFLFKKILEKIPERRGIISFIRSIGIRRGGIKKKIRRIKKY